jgi:hypothetical protein
MEAMTDQRSDDADPAWWAAFYDDAYRAGWDTARLLYSADPPQAHADFLWVFGRLLEANETNAELRAENKRLRARRDQGRRRQ